MSGAKLQASGLLRLEQDGELHVLERLGRLTGVESDCKTAARRSRMLVIAK
jgi:hypothetical protein